MLKYLINLSLLIGITIGSDLNKEIIVTTESGLKYIEIKEGKGNFPKAGDFCSVHYTGTLEDGTKFDSSHDRGEPIEFPVGMGRVIKGWDEGIMTMKPGGKRKLIIPANLGYGERGTGSIPPNSILHFDVELVNVKKQFKDTDFELPGQEIVKDSGLRMIEHINGNGAKPEKGQTVIVHYTGMLDSGVKFDSSHDRNKPFDFQLGLGRVIKGWDEGIADMTIGSKRTFIIPPELGYGSKGAGGVIPPNSLLIFEVELIGIK